MSVHRFLVTPPSTPASGATPFDLKMTMWQATCLYSNWLEGRPNGDRETWLVTVFGEHGDAFLDAARTVGVTVEEIEGGGDTESYVLRVGAPGSGWAGSKDAPPPAAAEDPAPVFLTLDQIDGGDEFNGVKVGQLGEDGDEGVFAFTHDQDKAIDAAHALFASTGDQIHSLSVTEVKWWRVVDTCGCGDTCPHQPDEDGETEHDSCLHFGLPPCRTEQYTWVGLNCAEAADGALPVILMEVKLR